MIPTISSDYFTKHRLIIAMETCAHSVGYEQSSNIILAIFVLQGLVSVALGFHCILENEREVVALFN
jgi:hypothetical protein